MPSFWNRLRSDFTIHKNFVYLDHASCGPLPKPVTRQIEALSRENAGEADLAWPKWIRRREEVREKVARFIHADPSEITFISNTSQGMNYVADCLAARGTVLTNTCEFPASTLPWIWRKSKIIWQKPDRQKISLRKLKTLMNPKVRTILTSYVQYSTGFRQDLEQLGRMKGNRFLVVNATQGFGAFPVNVQKWKADFLVANSYKWLLAGYGGGILYVRKKWLNRFEPNAVGWRSMKVPEKMDNRKIDLKRDASRYELGCPSYPTIFAIGAAVEYLSSIGIEKISKRILSLTDYLIRELDQKGLEVLSPREPEHRSGIVVFKVKNPPGLWRRLLAKKIFVSVRGEGIRVAPHFYNTFEEIDKLVAGVRNLI